MAEQTIRVGVIGATGYAGMELVRLLLAHPQLSLTYMAGSRARDEAFAELFPHLLSDLNLSIEAYHPDACQAACDFVFVALPSGQSGLIAAELWERGLRVIDLSGDLRLPAKSYQSWYNKEPMPEHVQRAAVYGLTEFYRESIAQATLVANPGCYATAALLALKPIESAPFISAVAPIIVDAKSGVTGAGRSVKEHLQFAELANDFYAYRVGSHQHIPEIEQTLNFAHSIAMTTQLLPLSRGIFASVYIPTDGQVSGQDIYRHYAKSYAESTFVHVLPNGQQPHLKSVQGSNYCHLGLVLNERTGLLQVFCAIDNLQKGASGQALQNANVMLGLPEDVGLQATSVWM